MTVSAVDVLFWIACGALGYFVGYLISTFIDSCKKEKEQQTWMDLYYDKKAEWTDINDKILFENGRLVDIARTMYAESARYDPDGLATGWARCWPWLPKTDVEQTWIVAYDEEDEEEDGDE